LLLLCLDPDSPEGRFKGSCRPSPHISIAGDKDAGFAQTAACFDPGRELAMLAGHKRFASAMTRRFEVHPEWFAFILGR
jgi:hypothetical protein